MAKPGSDQPEKKRAKTVAKYAAARRALAVINNVG